MGFLASMAYCSTNKLSTRGKALRRCPDRIASGSPSPYNSGERVSVSTATIGITETGIEAGGWLTEQVARAVS